MKITIREDTPKIMLFHHLKKGDTFMLFDSNSIFIKIDLNGEKAISLGSGDSFSVESGRVVFPCTCELIVNKD